ncbi:MAG: MBL fold metallo-hydrolase, partial [Nevskiales bacterium]
MLEVHQFPCLHDNYGFILRDAASGQVATVDTPDADAITIQLEQRGWGLDVIMNTHHHPDHAGGNLALKERYGCRIVGPRGEAATIPGIDVLLGDADVFELGESRAMVYETPGHTLGHIVYHFADDAIA